MSTHSYIGITEDGKKVKYVYCQMDGYLSYNGVMLDMFYKDRQKVDKLISLGFISSLKYKESVPKVFYDFQDVSYISCESNLHVKTGFTVHFCTKGVMEDNCFDNSTFLDKKYEPKVVDILKYNPDDLGETFVYLYDVRSGKWYVSFKLEGGFGNYKLHDLLVNFEKFRAYYRKVYNTSDEDYILYEFNNVQKTIKRFREDISEKNVLDTYNDYILNTKGITDYEFCYVKNESGKQVFGLAEKLKQGQKKRKIVYRSECIGELVGYLITMERKRYQDGLTVKGNSKNKPYRLI